MISHIHKVIFIHVPKCAGSSIEYYFEVQPFDWREPNFETLCGWDPRRKIHLQHATAQQMLELELVDEKIWNNYFKFSFIRNPWDRAYSDYYWMMRETGIRDSFENFLLKKNQFSDVLNNQEVKEYRGDHLIPQINFLKVNEKIDLDFIGRFENFSSDFKKIRSMLGLERDMGFHAKKSTKKHPHYSYLYNKKRMKLVQKLYQEDVSYFDYFFEDKKTLFQKILMALQ